MGKKKLADRIFALFAVVMICVCCCASPAVRDSEPRAAGRHNQRITGIAFTRDSGRFYAVSRDGTVSLWNGRGEFLKILTGYYDNQVLLDVSPDGAMVLTAGGSPPDNWPNRVNLWHVEKGLLKKLPYMSGAKFLNDREFIAAHNKSLSLYRCDSEIPVRQIPLSESDSVVFGNRGAFVVVGKEGMAYFDRLESAPKKLPAPLGKFSNIVFSGDDSVIASLHTEAKPDARQNWKYSVRAWQRNGVPIANFWHGEIQWGDLSVGVDGGRFYLGARNGVNVFDRKGKILATYTTGGRSRANDPFPGGPDFRVTADEKLVAALHDDTLFLFSKSGGVKRIDYGKDRMLAFALSPDGRFLALGSIYGSLQLWTAAGTRILRTADNSRPAPADFMKKPGEFTGRDRDIVAGESMKGIWVSRDKLRALALGRPAEGLQAAAGRKSAREAAFKNGMGMVMGLLLQTRIEVIDNQGGCYDLASTMLGWRRELKFLEKAGKLVSERYDKSDVCHAIIELEYPDLRDRVEWKGKYSLPR